MKRTECSTANTRCFNIANPSDDLEEVQAGSVCNTNSNSKRANCFHCNIISAKSNHTLCLTLRSILSIPAAVECIRANSTLKEALRDALGENDAIYARIFGTTCNLSNASLIDVRSRTTEEEFRRSQSDFSDFSIDYEDDFAQAVSLLNNQITKTTLENKEASRSITLNKFSSSPNSFNFFGVSPGDTSQDGEPVAALWPRQPHQFAFTQEEENTIRAEDEVYSEVDGSISDHGTVSDREEEDDLDEVFNMEDDAETDNVSETNFKHNIYRSETVETDLVDEEEAVDHQYDDDGSRSEASIKYDSLFIRIIREESKTGFESSKDFRPCIGSKIVDRYKVEYLIGEAVFSRTYGCIDIQTNERVCLKIIKNRKEYFDQGLDEIRIMRYIAERADVDNMHLLRLLDYFYFHEHLVMVTELLRDNLYEFSRLVAERGLPTYFSIARLKKISIQILEGIKLLHSIGLIHCDLKPENIVIKSFSECSIKVIDFGSACFITDELTPYVQSRSYRAPEVILGIPYDQKIDIWSLGCILVELLTGEVLFKNDSEQSLLARILTTIGPIPVNMIARHIEQIKKFEEQKVFRLDSNGNTVLISPRRSSSLKSLIPTSDPDFMDFISGLLAIDPVQRLSASDALAHRWILNDNDAVSYLNET